MTSSKMTIRLMSASMVLGFLTSATTMADDHFTRFADELNRCVEAARASAIQPTTRQIRHFVTEDGAAGVWARFEIRTELYDVQDGPVVKTIESSCRAHRWNDQTLLEQ